MVETTRRELARAAKAHGARKEPRAHCTRKKIAPEARLHGVSKHAHGPGGAAGAESRASAHEREPEEGPGHETAVGGTHPVGAARRAVGAAAMDEQPAESLLLHTAVMRRYGACYKACFL